MSESLTGLIDRWTTRLARSVAVKTSRRGFLGRIGVVVAGASTLPLLPIERAQAEAPGATDDPTTCEYWRYCAIDGYLCSCCGGSDHSCPPGTEMSQITWIGTCRNPADGQNYVISYNDCCGKSACLRCGCNRNDGDTPVYMPTKANDIMWCLGTKTQSYNCSVARIVGTANAPG